jgi:hypothetical protein
MKLEDMRECIVDHRGKKYAAATIIAKLDSIYIVTFNLKRHGLSGKGLGRKFYFQLESLFYAKGIRYIYGELESDSYEARGFWEKMGFRTIKIHTESWKKKASKIKELFNWDITCDLVFKDLTKKSTLHNDGIVSKECR